MRATWPGRYWLQMAIGQGGAGAVPQLPRVMTVAVALRSWEVCEVARGLFKWIFSELEGEKKTLDT